MLIKPVTVIHNIVLILRRMRRYTCNAYSSALYTFECEEVAISVINGLKVSG